MSEQVPSDVPADGEDFDTPIGLDNVTPLRRMLAEVHEVYEELLLVGFNEPAATRVIANMLGDALLYRNPYSEENDDLDGDYEDDDDDEDYDNLD